MASNSIEMLFACTHCHKRYSLDELSQVQQLCKACRKKHPSIPCNYCRLDFHQLEDTKGKPAACDQCLKELKQYGDPSNCSICNLRSAFKGSKCTRCSHSQKKYGAPVQCEQCKLHCAFKKSSDTKKKVDGKTLCLLCTLNYKKALFRQKTRQQQKRHHSHHTTEQSNSKKAKTEESTSLLSSSSVPYPLTSSKDSNSVDPLSSELMQETEKLRDQVSNLKRQLSQKEQMLIEKDKTICTLKAENLEKEKDYRQKLQTSQRSHNDVVENLKIEIQGLKKQLAQQFKVKTKPQNLPTSATTTLLK